MTTATARRGRKPRTWTTGPQMALGRLGEQRALTPVTLPKLNLIAIDIEHEAKETAERENWVRAAR